LTRSTVGEGDAEENIDTYEAGSDKKLEKKFIERNFTNCTLYAVAQMVEALRYKPGGGVAGSIPDGDIGIFH